MINGAALTSLSGQERLFSPLDGGLSLKKYHQVYLVLRQHLIEGQFLTGVPGEKALAESYGVGRVTVRRALEQLVHDGLIIRKAGSGTHPVQPSQVGCGMPGVPAAEGRQTRLSGLMQNIINASQGTSVRVIEWRIIPGSGAIANSLGLSPGERVRKGVRCRSTALGPISLITTYVPLGLVRSIRRQDLARKPMLQHLQDLGIALGRATQTVSARQADAIAAQELAVPLGSALLYVNRTVFDLKNRPVQLLSGLYRPDRYEYAMEISKIGSVAVRVNSKEVVESAQ
jgi:GntR family transcriptional regulator